MAVYTVKDNATGKTVSFQWNAPQPPTEADFEEVFAAALGAAPEVQPTAAPTPAAPGGITGETPWGEVASRAVGNIPGNVMDIGRGLASLVASPVESAKAIYGAGKEAVGRAGESLAAGLPGQGMLAPVGPMAMRYTVDDAGNMVPIDDFRNVERLKRSIAEEPVSTALGVAGGVTGAGLGAKVAGKLAGSAALESTGSALSGIGSAIDPIQAAGRAVKLTGRTAARVAGETVGMTTGTGYGAIKTAMREAGTSPYVKALRGEVDQADLLGQARDAIHAIKDERSLKYRQQLADLQASGTTIDIAPIQAKLDNLLKQYGVKDTPDGLDFSRSTLDTSEVSRVTELVDTVRGWGSQPGDLAPAMMDTLKRRLDDFYSPSKNSRALVSSLRNEVKSAIEKQVPEYATMTAEYAKYTGLVKDIEDALSLKTTKATDTAIKRLTSALRDNNEFRANMLQSLNEYSGANLPGQVAGMALSPAIPRGLVGRGIASGIGFAALGNPQMFALLASGSPRVVGEFLNVLGMGKKAIGKIPTPPRPAITTLGILSDAANREEEENLYRLGGNQ